MGPRPAHWLMLGAPHWQKTGQI